MKWKLLQKDYEKTEKKQLFSSGNPFSYFKKIGKGFYKKSPLAPSQVYVPWVYFFSHRFQRDLDNLDIYANASPRRADSKIMIPIKRRALHSMNI